MTSFGGWGFEDLWRFMDGGRYIMQSLKMMSYKLNLEVEDKR